MIASSIFERLLDTIEPHRLWLYRAIALWATPQKNERANRIGVMHAFCSHILMSYCWFSFSKCYHRLLWQRIFFILSQLKEYGSYFKVYHLRYEHSYEHSMGIS